jgi:hypothetical protein
MGRKPLFDEELQEEIGRRGDLFLRNKDPKISDRRKFLDGNCSQESGFMGPEAEGRDKGDPGSQRHELFDGFGVVDGHDRFKGVGGKIFFQQLPLDDLSCSGARLPSNEGNLSEYVERDRSGRGEKGMVKGVDEDKSVVIQEFPVKGDPLSPCRLSFNES